jgi:hypothetical protein
MVVTMTLSDILNNTATAIVAAPVAITMADRLSVNPDPFLMAVAVAASAAFLTPIGHKNNTLILGPRGLPVRGLLAHGPAAGGADHRGLDPRASGVLAAVIRRLRTVGRAGARIVRADRDGGSCVFRER